MDGLGRVRGGLRVDSIMSIPSFNAQDILFEWSGKVKRDGGELSFLCAANDCECPSLSPGWRKRGKEMLCGRRIYVLYTYNIIVIIHLFIAAQINLYV